MSAFPSSKTAVPLAFGAMTVGEAGKSGVRITDMTLFQNILDLLKKHGVDEIDSARVYGDGSSESVLGAIKAEQQGFKIATKNFPNRSFFPDQANMKYDHSPHGVQQALGESLDALRTDCVDLYYLHAPDRKNNFHDTLQAIDQQYRQGKFKRFGISNYTADETEELLRICNENGYVKPTVYQGLYNVVIRTAEGPLLPVLRKHKISYYIYNPLGGGFFTGSIKRDSVEQAARQATEQDPNAHLESGSRFDKSTGQGKMYRKRYFHDSVFDALDEIQNLAKQHSMTMNEIALRWCVHHSVLREELGDRIIFSASSLDHVEQNLVDFEKGPLPEDVVKALDKVWLTYSSSGQGPAYHF
jgi:aflatoxin B1 aldehyde reductase